VKHLGKIIRSVQAFGRELSSRSIPLAPKTTQSIGLALGGGFARGIAHIGVLKVLEQENIPIRYIAGTSVGALIGAAYCSGVSAAELEALSVRVRFKHFARWTLSRYGFASNDRMIGFLSSILKVKTFEELCIPLAVTATDFSTGDGVVFDSGSLIEPVRASCAYPGMFSPVRIDGRWLVDGMLAHAVPTTPLRKMGADRVLGVHLKGRWASPEGAPRHMFDVIGQCFSIAQDMTCGLWKEAADLIIEPDVNGFKYDDFEHSQQLIHAGEAVTRAVLPQLRAWLEPEPVSTAKKKRAARLTQPAAMPAD
jgi:NTE family protein